MNRKAFLNILFLLPLSTPFLASLNFSSSQSYCLPMDLRIFLQSLPVGHLESFNCVRGAIVEIVEAVVPRVGSKDYLILTPSSTGACRTQR